MAWTAFKIFLMLSFLTGGVYPFLVTGIAQFGMPFQAKGSLIFIEGKLRGSDLIAQRFQQQRYFWPRPSATSYDATRSGGSQLGPTSLILKKRIFKTASDFSTTYNVALNEIPKEMIYTSGSGLDPHISLETAYFQWKAIAQDRQLSEDQRIQFRDLMRLSTEGHRGQLLGRRYLNVFKLNRLLDSTFSPDHSS